MMRILPILLVLVVGGISALAQAPVARIVNRSRPAAHDFQIGDQFEILITGAPNKPLSVRTTMQGRTDWGPVIASTDATGRWSTTGRFEKNDFGDWSEVWTVGGKVATPAIHFFVAAPCLPGRANFVSMSGPNQSVSCETAEGRQSFVTPSLPDSFRTPDGRSVAGRKRGNMTADEYQMEILEHFITSGRDSGPAHVSLQSSRGGGGDEVLDLIARLIGPNALDETESRNVLAILRAAFEKQETIAPSARTPLKTIPFLQHMADSTDQESLKREIEETIAYVQSRPSATANFR